MPARKLLIRREILVNLGGEALKVAGSVVFHFPGGLVAKAVVEAGQKLLKQEFDRKRRDSAIRKFVAETSYLQGDLIRIADFVKRNAPDAIMEPESSGIVANEPFFGSGRFEAVVKMIPLGWRVAIVVLALVTIAIPPVAMAQPGPYLIVPGRNLGPIELGMRMDEVVAFLATPRADRSHKGRHGRLTLEIGKRKAAIVRLAEPAEQILLYFTGTQSSRELLPRHKKVIGPIDLPQIPPAPVGY